MPGLTSRLGGGMELCARKVSTVHQFSAIPAGTPDCFGEMSEKRRALPMLCRDVDEQELICPKPRHTMFGMCSQPLEESGRVVRRLKGSTTLPTDGEVGHEILDILLKKVNSMDLSNSGNLSAHMVMSPPRRAGNPMIRDLHFFQKRAMPSPVNTPHVFSSFRGTGPVVKTFKVSCELAPCMRVEGFASSTTGECNQEAPAFT